MLQQEKFLGAKKTQKIDFLKRTKTSVIWPNIEGGSHNSPGHLGTIRPQYSIQKESTLLWPSVCGMGYCTTQECNEFNLDWIHISLYEMRVTAAQMHPDNAQKNLSWVGWNFIQVTGWHFFAGWSAGKPLLAMAGEMWDSEQPVAPTFKDALLAPTSALFTYTISTFNSNKFIKVGKQTLLTAIWTKYI